MCGRKHCCAGLPQLALGHRDGGMVPRMGLERWVACESVREVRLGLSHVGVWPCTGMSSGPGSSSEGTGERQEKVLGSGSVCNPQRL